MANPALDTSKGFYSAVIPGPHEISHGSLQSYTNPDGSPARSAFFSVRASAGLAILLSVSTIVLLVVVVFVPIALTPHGPLSGNMRTLYVTGITILATLHTTFLVRQLRAMYLLDIDRYLKFDRSIQAVDSRWRVVIGTASVRDQMAGFGPALLLIVAGLSTAAIVGALVPTSSLRTVALSILIPDDNGYICAAAYADNRLIGGPQWSLPNGSVYIVQPEMQFCPTSVALSTLGSVNAIGPDAFGYHDQGVAVRRAALGAPATIYASQANVQLPGSIRPTMNTTLATYGSSLASTSHCVPVMTANPVQCKPVAAVIGNNSVTVTSADGCTVAVAGSSAALVAGNFCAHGELGQATAVFVTTYGMSMFLSEAVADYAWLAHIDIIGGPATLEESGYGVVCNINAQDIYHYRNVTLSLQASPTLAGGYARVLDGQGEACQPEYLPGGLNSDPTQHKLPATAATAAWTLVEGSTIITSARQLLIVPYSSSEDHSVYVRQPPFGFANSRNALEDILGLNAAMVAAQVGLTDGSSSWPESSSKLEVNYTRIGTGNRWAIVYILPNLVTLVLLVYIIFVTKGEDKHEPLTASLAGLAVCFERDLRR